MAGAHPALEALAASLRERPWEAVALSEPVPVTELPTPALLLDEARLDANIERMAGFLAGRGKGVRPHAKTHKCPLIARRQLQAGAVGICAAKVSEALVLAGAGIDRILITSPVLSPAKLAVVGSLAAPDRAIDIVVDSLQGLDALRAMANPAAPIGVLVDVDVAMGRTGTRDADTILRLAEAAASSDGLIYRGVQHYAGQVMHVAGHTSRRDKSLGLWERVRAVVRALTDRGLAPAVVTGSGTGTYDIDSEVDFITDLQVGSYVFMDRDYLDIGGASGDVFDDFEVSLTVAATAISQPREGLITFDAGYKAFASDSGNPRPLTVPGATEYRFAGDEHGVLLLGSAAQEPLLGTVQQFVTPHCDPTVNLYDAYWLCRDGAAVARWPIAARGCSW
ncbi:MAG: DSD1 family PLP-dependent enzyme [Pseudomonadales bacterium]